MWKNYKNYKEKMKSVNLQLSMIRFFFFFVAVLKGWSNRGEFTDSCIKFFKECVINNRVYNHEKNTNKTNVILKMT